MISNFSMALNKHNGILVIPFFGTNKKSQK